MGRRSATTIFDSVCDDLIAGEPEDDKEILKLLIRVLEDGDVEQNMKELRPSLFEDGK